MAFISILIVTLGMMLFAIIVLGVLSVAGVSLLTVGIIFLKRNKKAGKRIVAPVISIVAGSIFLAPVVLSILWYLYMSVTNSVIRLEDAAAILMTAK